VILSLLTKVTSAISRRRIRFFSRMSTRGSVHIRGTLLGQLQDVAPRLGVEGSYFWGLATLIIFDGVGMDTQLLVPLGFKGISDEAVIGINFHYNAAAPGQRHSASRSIADGATHPSRRRGALESPEREAHLSVIGVITRSRVR